MKRHSAVAPLFIVPAAIALLLATTSAPAAEAPAAPATGPGTPDMLQDGGGGQEPGMAPGDMRQAMPPGRDSAMPGIRHAGAARSYTPANLKWGDAPPALPKGAQAAVLDGDPHQAGPYVVRLKMPPGYTIPPHWHSKAENLTVISGTLSLGMGDTLDRKAAQDLPAGGFHSIAAQVHHYAFTRQGAVVQIHGEGPFDITYINPADNPAAASPKPR